MFGIRSALQLKDMEKFEKEKLKSRQILEVANKVWDCDDRWPEGFTVRARDGSQISSADSHAREGLS